MQASMPFKATSESPNTTSEGLQNAEWHAFVALTDVFGRPNLGGRESLLPIPTTILAD
jgi:hypothetical protein